MFDGKSSQILIGNGGIACGEKVVYQIEIICGNFFTCLFGLFLDTVETLVDVANGNCVKVLLLGGHGIPLLRTFCLFYSYAKQNCFVTVLVLSDDLLLEGLVFIGQNIGI
ncbi:MAG: hypothetical protein E6899_00230 [Neisseria sp.]|nr:hypothetical protein [Neisseria sp.]